MNNTFISVLGTNNYLECRYNNGDIVKYVQEDLIKRYCIDWDEVDEIRIFLTKEARSKNWEDNGHILNGNIISNKGLCKRLEDMKLKARIVPIDIPVGNSESEIWQIFEIVYNSFKPGDRIIFDITHSFRSIPMFVMVLLNYARLLKDISIMGLYYGAFEVMGDFNTVKSILPEKRNAPIFDLVSFTTLQDWTLATHNFIRNGIPSDLVKLTKEKINPVLAQTKGKDEIASELRKFIKNLDDISNNIFICRGKDILEYDYSKIHENISTLKSKNVFIKPLVPLLEKIEHKVSKFNNNDIMNGFNAAEWCINHNLYQQAITILQETIITYILHSIKLDWKDKEFREVVSGAFAILSQEIPENNWAGSAKNNPDVTKTILNHEITLKLKKDYDKLTSLRNDVNHAGYLKDNKKYSNIYSSVYKIFEEVKKKLFN